MKTELDPIQKERQKKLALLDILKSNLAEKRRKLRSAQDVVECVEWHIRDLCKELADFDGVGIGLEPEVNFEPENTNEAGIDYQLGLHDENDPAPEPIEEAAPEQTGDELPYSKTDFFMEVMRWVGNSPIRGGCDQAMGRRAMAMIWVLMPSVFDGVSLRKLCKAAGITASKFSLLTGDFSRQFNVRSHAQSHAANFKS
jgi:hypothetical protein